jgi:hypothetical protein
MPVSELLGILDDAEKEKREFSAVVDLLCARSAVAMG